MANNNSKLTKAELIDHVAALTGQSTAATKATLEALAAVATGALKQGNSVPLVGLGVLERRHRKARTGVRPGTAERMEIPATDYPAFKAGQALKSAVSED